MVQLITCFQGPSGRRIGAAETYPSAEEREQATLLGDRELIRRGRCGSGVRQWRSRREGGGIAAAWRLVARRGAGGSGSGKRKETGPVILGAGEAAGQPATGARRLVRGRD